MFAILRGLPGGADNGERGYMLTFVIAYIRVSIVFIFQFYLTLKSFPFFTSLNAHKFFQKLKEISILKITPVWHDIYTQLHVDKHRNGYCLTF